LRTFAFIDSAYNFPNLKICPTSIPFLICIVPFPSGDGLPSSELISSPSFNKSSVLIANSEESLTAIVSSPFSAKT